MSADLLFFTTDLDGLAAILFTNEVAPTAGPLRFTEQPQVSLGGLAVGILRLVFDDGGHPLVSLPGGEYAVPNDEPVGLDAKDVIEVWVDDTGLSGIGSDARALLAENGFGDVAVRNVQEQEATVGAPVRAWASIADVVVREGVKPNTAQLLPLDAYDYVIVSFSGGKDSLACVLYLLELGVDPGKMELWHQSVDGDPWKEPTSAFYMDWPCTPPYCEALARELRIPLLYQWRDGGFEGEMLKTDARSQPVVFQNARGEFVTVPTTKQASIQTRRRFPMRTANMATRWCSSTLKIEPAAKAITNDPRFLNGRKILFVTGERRQESENRAKYAEIEAHRTNTKTGRRTAHHWRPIINWTEERVWAIIAHYRLIPHPAYLLGWSRVSCIACIFGKKDQWASVRAIDPSLFGAIAHYERIFDAEQRALTDGRRGGLLHRRRTVTEVADQGREHVTDKPKATVRRAMSRKPWRTALRLRPGVEWVFPAGAFTHQGGPT